jgi:hypothetical protein
MRRPQFPPDDRQFHLEDYAPRGFLALWIRLVLIAGLFGLACGVVWTLWHLLRLHVFG